MLRRKLDPELHGSGGYTSVMRLAAIGLAVGFLVIGAHMGFQAWYDGRILPGVKVASHDLSGKTLAQARKILQKEVASYRLKMTVAQLRYELTAEQLGVTFDVEETVKLAYGAGREAWLPPLHQEPIELAYRLDRAQLNAFTKSVQDKVGTPPIDAGVVLKGETLTTVPEKSGWTVDRLGMQRLIESDVRAPRGHGLALQPREQLADIQVKALGPAIMEAKQLMATPVILTYGEQVFTPTPAQIGQWLAFQKQPDGTLFKLTPQVDVAELKDYVQSLADKLNVAPVNAKVTIKNGVKEISQEGKDGLAINQDEAVKVIMAAVTAQKPLTFTLTAHGVPFKTVSTTFVTLDYGKYIEVNLSRQHLWVWEDHNVIYESALTSGATGAGMGTVTGLFSIYYKTTNTHLRGQGYDVAVKYWMPFYLGYGMHDATWRGGRFGGQDYYYGGSHGCVNLPDAAAEFIYNWASVGTPVWVHT